MQTDVIGHHITGEFYELLPSGMLIIKLGYAWDGASGPTVDTDDSMRGSLVHDVLCQMIRRGQLPKSLLGLVNAVFHDILIEDGMWKVRAGIWKDAVDTFADNCVEKPEQIYTAP